MTLHPKFKGGKKHSSLEVLKKITLPLQFILVLASEYMLHVYLETFFLIKIIICIFVLHQLFFICISNFYIQNNYLKYTLTLV